MTYLCTMEQIENLLITAGIKPTSIRIMVMKEIVAYNHPFTLANMEDRLCTVDKSSLFRTLQLLLKHKLLHDIDNGSGSKLYCRCKCVPMHTSHIHFTCTYCGQTYCVKDIDISTIPHPKGFVVEEMNFVMKGLCFKCTKYNL